MAAMANTSRAFLFGLRLAPLALLAAARAVFPAALSGSGWVILWAIGLAAYWMIDRYYAQANQSVQSTSKQRKTALLAVVAILVLFGLDDYFNPGPVFLSFLLMGVALVAYGLRKAPTGATLLIAAGALSIGLGLAPLFGFIGELHVMATGLVLSACLFGLGLAQHRAISSGAR